MVQRQASHMPVPLAPAVSSASSTYLNPKPGPAQAARGRTARQSALDLQPCQWRCCFAEGYRPPPLLPPPHAPLVPVVGTST